MISKNILILNLPAFALVAAIDPSLANAAARWWDGTNTTANADGGNGTWDQAATSNWRTAETGGSATTYSTGTTAQQATFGLVSGTVTVSGTVYISGNSTSPGSAGLYAATPGTTYSFDGTGTIQLGGGAYIHAFSGVTFGSDLTINNAGQTLTFSNGGVVNALVSGSGAVVKGGGGTLQLLNANTYTGKTTINQGILTINTIANVSGGNSSLGAPTTSSNGTIDLGNAALDATLRYVGTGHSTNRVINLSSTTGTPTLDMSGTGTLTFSSNFIANGGGAKTLILTGSTTGIGQLNGTIVNNTLSNTTALTKNGTGTWMLVGSNSYTGPTTINQGVLSVSSLAAGGSPSNLGAAGVGAGNLILNGGTLRYTGSSAGTTNRVFSLQSSSTIDASGTAAFVFSSGSPMGFNGGTAAKTLTLTGTSTADNRIDLAIADNVNPTSILKTGSGTWRLSGGNSYTGGTTITDGLLKTESPSALGSANGALTINGGTLDLSNINIDVGNLTGTGGSIINSVAGTRTLTIGNGDATGGNYQGAISAGTGTLALTKTGSGIITLSGANTYTGSTEVNAGTLLINGSLVAASAVNVNNSAVLGGIGTINGSVTLDNSSTLSPGSSPGQLTVGSLTLGATTNTLMELGGTTLGSQYDNLTVILNGGLTYGGDLDVVNINAFDLASTSATYDLFAFGGATSPSGNFASVTVNGVSLNNNAGLWTNTVGLVSYAFSQATGDLSITMVPEPSSLAMLAIGAISLWLFKRRK